MVTKSMEGFLIKFCAFRRRSVSKGEERNVSKYEKKVLLLATIILLSIIIVVLTACGKNNTEGESNGGLFGKKLSEQVKVGDYIAYNAGEGNSYTSPKLKNGSYDQTFETTGEEKWRVISIEDDGTITLVSEEPFQTNKEMYFTLRGGAGYLNAVEELNNICAIYGKGEHAISARSMKYEDIIKGIGFDTLEAAYDITLSGTDDEKIKTLVDTIATKQSQNNNSSRNENYGTEFTLVKKENQYKPSDENEDGYIEGGEQTLKDNYVPSILVENWFTREKELLELLFGTKKHESFWLANTSIEMTYEGWFTEENRAANYRVYYAYTGSTDSMNAEISDERLYKSSMRGGDKASSLVRPLVILDKETKTTGGTGTSDDPFILK